MKSILRIAAVILQPAYISDARAGFPNVVIFFTGDQPEARNYASEKPEIVQQLRELHEDWSREVTPE